ncbi:hypothetical protein [Brevundimonas pondensis]|uniref:hypothetical protein n=1 Tax=Brevundimonas pondensis TaxID=2774189 RepID=UPI001CED37A4|nr:hypothetical protein [Brevundimonas pondensis]
MTVWLVMLAAPQLAPGFGLNIPAMLGLTDPYAAGVFLSLSLNLGVFVAVSKLSRPRLIDRVQARAFADRLGPDWMEGRGASAGASVGDLKALVARFIGDERAERAFAAWARETDRELRDADPADAGLARAAERMLAGPSAPPRPAASSPPPWPPEGARPRTWCGCWTRLRRRFSSTATCCRPRSTTSTRASAWWTRTYA